jgi:hypothetical protein
VKIGLHTRQSNLQTVAIERVNLAKKIKCRTSPENWMYFCRTNDLNDWPFVCFMTKDQAAGSGFLDYHRISLM